MSRTTTFFIAAIGLLSGAHAWADDWDDCECDPGEVTVVSYDFKNDVVDVDGVDAYKHCNGGGWVAVSATVCETVHVDPGARVYGHAGVLDEVKIQGTARVYGWAKIEENAIVTGNARVYQNAYVGEEAEIEFEARVYGQARVVNAVVGGQARVYRNAKVGGQDGKPNIYGQARVCGNAFIYDRAQVYGHAHVFGEATVKYAAQVYDYARVFKDSRIYGGQVHGSAQIFGDHKGKATFSHVSGTADISGDAVVCRGASISSGEMSSGSDPENCNPNDVEGPKQCE